MRQRKIKNLEEKLERHERFFIESPDGIAGKWAAQFAKEAPLFLELGCGKGKFLLSLAARHPECNFVGIEGQASVVLRALEKLEELRLSNVRFCCGFVNHPDILFAQGELAGIYLNFSDPWPKPRHARKRLTDGAYLRAYHKILLPTGFVAVKTDNEGLFQYTAKQAEMLSTLFGIEEITENLQQSDFAAKEITSEYEEKFMAAGMGIRYVKLRRRDWVSGER